MVQTNHSEVRRKDVEESPSSPHSNEILACTSLYAVCRPNSAIPSFKKNANETSQFRGCFSVLKRKKKEKIIDSMAKIGPPRVPGIKTCPLANGHTRPPFIFCLKYSSIAVTVSSTLKWLAEVFKCPCT
jgi:hypothetical protein